MHFVLIDKGLSLSPEINEDEASKEQEYPCVQDTDDLVGLSSSEDAEKRTDPVLSSRYFLYGYSLCLHLLTVPEGGV